MMTAFDARGALDACARKYLTGVRVAAKQGVIPYGAQGDKWLPPPMDGDAWWTNGFWPGVCWQLYALTGEECCKTEARRVGKRLIDVLREHTALHHDVGFQYLLSCGADWRLTGDEEMLRHTLHAADVLMGRYNPVGFIRAWNGADRAGWAIIDCTMNLNLLLFASARTGDPRYRNVALRYVDTVIRHFQRADGSMHHIVIFDPATGDVLDTPRGQGCAPGSSWSRGQAWALYGLTLCYQNSGEERCLTAARRVADYFVAHIRPDGLTDCDFCQPPDEERIDNIAAACAACGLIVLARILQAPEYERAALRMLNALCSLCVRMDDGALGLLTKCTASYHDDGAGRHVNMVYGDYFLIEALKLASGLDDGFWRA